MTRYHKVNHDPAAIESLFVDLFLDAHEKAPKQIILDLDATDDPLHGNQEGQSISRALSRGLQGSNAKCYERRSASCFFHEDTSHFMEQRLAYGRQWR